MLPIESKGRHTIEHAQTPETASGRVPETSSPPDLTALQVLGREAYCRLQELTSETDYMGMARDPDSSFQLGILMLTRDSNVPEADAKRALLEAKHDYATGQFDVSQCPTYEEMGDRIPLSAVRPF